MRELLVLLNKFDQATDNQNQIPCAVKPEQLAIIREYIEDDIPIVQGRNNWNYMGPIGNTVVLTSTPIKGVKTIVSAASLPPKCLIIGGVDTFKSTITSVDKITVIRVDTKYFSKGRKLNIPDYFEMVDPVQIIDDTCQIETFIRSKN